MKNFPLIFWRLFAKQLRHYSGRMMAAIFIDSSLVKLRLRLLLSKHCLQKMTRAWRHIFDLTTHFDEMLATILEEPNMKTKLQKTQYAM